MMGKESYGEGNWIDTFESKRRRKQNNEKNYSKIDRKLSSDDRDFLNGGRILNVENEEEKLIPVIEDKEAEEEKIFVNPQDRGVEQEDLVNIHQNQREDIPAKTVVMNHNIFSKKNFEFNDGNRALNQINDKKDIYIAYVVDGTYSFHTIYTGVYYIIQQSLKHIKTYKREYEAIQMHYGLVLIRETGGEIVKFNGTYFTENEDTFLSKLEKLDMYGGNTDTGREKINEAVEEAICLLCNETPSEASRGLICYTDSVPEDMTPDFRDIDGCTSNIGLRFATFYVNNDEYAPKMHLVDRSGSVVDNNRNVPVCYEIKTLLSDDSREQIQKQVIEIMEQVSVSSLS